MKIPFSLLISCCLLFTSPLTSTEFTVSSYNCGSLSEHYDYIRAAAMQKLMQERYNAEPAEMSKIERTQQLALKILFGKDTSTQAIAQQEWTEGNYQEFLEHITTAPDEAGSINAKWNQQSNKMLTTYNVRPIVINDDELQQMLVSHYIDLTVGGDQTIESNDFQELTGAARSVMGARIFHYQLKYDIICLQEADYLTLDMFPKHFHVELSDKNGSMNGVAWNKNRFELVELIGNIRDKGFAVLLLEKDSGKTVLVASGHLTGCNPIEEVVNPKTGISDSAAGDKQLKDINTILDSTEADIKLIAMDSNVTPMHPRLKMLKQFGYVMDAENFIEPTCTNPHLLLNTRLDWIALKTSSMINATITNIPVMGVGLNSLQTNLSDHKPVAARIVF